MKEDLANQAWSRSLMAALRRWWQIPVALGVLAGAIGFIAAARMPATASAQTSVQLVSSGGDSTLITQIVSSALERADERDVFEAAGKATGQDAQDLRARTTIAQVGTSMILEFTVTDPSAEKAAADANAVAHAAVDSSVRASQAALTDLTKRTDELMTQGRLSNKTVEAARQTSVAQQLGTAQSSLISNFGTLTVTAPATPTDVSRTSPASTALFSSAAGALLGLGIALTLGARRGPARSLSEIRRVTSFARVVDASRRASLLRTEAVFHRTFVLAPAGAGSDHEKLVERAVGDLQAAGYKVLHGSLRDLHGEQSIPKDSVLVIQEQASPELIQLTTETPGVLCLVLAKLGDVQLQDLSEMDEKAKDEYHIAVGA